MKNYYHICLVVSCFLRTLSFFMQVVKFILMKAFVIFFIPLIFELMIFLISFVRCLSILLILSKYQPGNVFYSSLFSVHWFLFLKISCFLNHLKFDLFFFLFLNGRTYIINFTVSCLIHITKQPISLQALNLLCL